MIDDDRNEKVEQIETNREAGGNTESPPLDKKKQSND